jgi:hypothetical protein
MGCMSCSLLSFVRAVWAVENSACGIPFFNHKNDRAYSPVELVYIFDLIMICIWIHKFSRRSINKLKDTLVNN